MDDTLPSPAGEPEMPEPFDYCYEWDGPFGTRKFSVAAHNGSPCSRSVPIFNMSQLRTYGDARAEHARREALEEAAAECLKRHANTNHMYDTREECADAIRALARKEGTA